MYGLDFEVKGGKGNIGILNRKHLLAPNLSRNGVVFFFWILLDSFGFFFYFFRFRMRLLMTYDLHHISQVKDLALHMLLILRISLYIKSLFSYYLNIPEKSYAYYGIP